VTPGVAIGLGANRADGPGTAEAARRRVAEYYDRMQVFYSTCWSSTGVHYGLWRPGTRRHAEAIRNMDRLVAEELALAPGSRVLDAGCGVGGTSLLLAEEFGLEMVGITVSSVQLARARRRAATTGAAVPPVFVLADYLQTGFPAGSFDGMFGIESVCYAESKPAFLAEAFRLLRPGGRLVVLDGFLCRPPLGRREQKDCRRFMDGVALTHLAGVEEFHADLRAAGFEDVRCTDLHAEIMPSAIRIEAITAAGVILFGIPFRLGLLPRMWLAHGLAGMSQRRLFQGRTLAYCAFVARRPER
jgi:tocopherol O-methyltransferase